MTITIWGKVRRPWGYEVRVDYLMADGRIINHCITTESELSDSQIMTLAEQDAARVTAPDIDVEGTI